jgi:hypothetical protein
MLSRGKGKRDVCVFACDGLYVCVCVCVCVCVLSHNCRQKHRVLSFMTSAKKDAMRGSKGSEAKTRKKRRHKNREENGRKKRRELHVSLDVHVCVCVCVCLVVVCAATRETRKHTGVCSEGELISALLT